MPREADSSAVPRRPPRSASDLHGERRGGTTSDLVWRQRPDSAGSSPANLQASAPQQRNVTATRVHRRGRPTTGGGGIAPRVVRLTFAAAVRDVLDDYRMNRRRSLADVERHVRLHLSPVFGRRHMATITTTDVRRYVAARQREGARNATINRELSVLKRAFTLAMAAGRLSRRLHIALLRENNVRRGFFEPAEFEAVRCRLPPDLADLVTFLYITGWRWRSEVARLQWMSVSFEAGDVRLDPGTTKTGEGRLFPFTAELRALLERRWAITRERERTLGRAIGLVFTRPRGEPIGSFNKAWATACRGAGVPDRVLHDFRRTAVRNLLHAGVSERVAMQLVGWKSRQMLDRYHIVNAADLVEAARKLDALRTR